MSISKLKMVIILLVMVVVAGEGYGQQRAQYTQYILNNYILNPASGGVNEYWDVKAGFRNQWTGLEGAPKTMFVSANGALGYPNKRVRNGAMKPHHGVGAYVFHDGSGPLSMTGFYGSYAYHLKVSRKWTASLGTFVGLMQYRINGSDLVFVQNPNDPMIGNNTLNHMVPDASLGLWVYSDRAFFGLSANQIFQNRLSFNNQATYGGNLNYHYFLTGGYRFKINHELDFIPSTMVKFVMGAPLQFDLNARVKYKDLFWGGLSYRRQDAVAIMAGLIISNQVEIGYSYDITTSKLRRASWGSHEIIVGLRLGRKGGKVLCPSDFWN
jgi:type IX secretion system PorP/SprF family membrane protein